jgi:hypothetical protein
MDTSTMGTFHGAWLFATFIMFCVNPLFGLVMLGLAFLYFIAAHHDAKGKYEYQCRMEELEEELRIADQTRAANDN